MKTLADFYIRFPIFIDGLLCAIVWVTGSKIQLIPYKQTSVEVQLNVMSSIIGTDVSLAGFILAALTIIVTFKSNITTKGMDQATDALGLIFSSEHYKAIKAVFKLAITEFVVLFIILYAAWTSSANWLVESLSLVNTCGILVTGAITLRTLLILFIVIDLDETKV